MTEIKYNLCMDWISWMESSFCHAIVQLNLHTFKVSNDGKYFMWWAYLEHDFILNDFCIIQTWFLSLGMQKKKSRKKTPKTSNDQETNQKTQ